MSYKYKGQNERVKETQSRNNKLEIRVRQNEYHLFNGRGKDKSYYFVLSDA